MNEDNNIQSVLKIKEQIREALLEIFPIWQMEPPSDLKRLVNRTEEGACHFSIVPYRGTYSYLKLLKKIEQHESLKRLDTNIRTLQPELFGSILHSASHINKTCQDVYHLSLFWSRVVQSLIEKGMTVEAAIDKVVADLDYLLTQKCGIYEVIMPLVGLKIPIEINEIKLGENIKIRQLDSTEFSELASRDITDVNIPSWDSKFVTCVLQISVKIDVTIKTSTQEDDHNISSLQQVINFQQQIQEQIDEVISSLHILKSGRVGILVYYKTLHPAVLPSMSRSISFPIIPNPYSFLELNSKEVQEFINLYQRLSTSQRDEVKIASKRLVDSENRLSSVDSLLDAVIGIETLLNPQDYSELSFRVALNYSFLADSSERRKRYVQIKEIQKTRNRVVHGGLNLRSQKDADTINQHSELARECLRDCITRFLNDSSLAGNQKLDTEFWLDRVIPPDENLSELLDI